MRIKPRRKIFDKFCNTPVPFSKSKVFLLILKCHSHALQQHFIRIYAPDSLTGKIEFPAIRACVTRQSKIIYRPK